MERTVAVEIEADSEASAPLSRVGRAYLQMAREATEHAVEYATFNKTKLHEKLHKKFRGEHPEIDTASCHHNLEH